MTRAERIKEGIARHEAAVRGVRGAAEEAYRLLKAAYEDDPGDYRTAAYYGSAAALMARDAASHRLAFGYGLEGTELLDDAVKGAPDDVTIRLLRAFVNAHLPDAYFHRRALAISDLEWLIDRYRRESSVMSSEAYRTVRDLLGRCRRAETDSSKNSR